MEGDTDVQSDNHKETTSGDTEKCSMLQHTQLTEALGKETDVAAKENSHTLTQAGISPKLDGATMVEEQEETQQQPHANSPPPQRLSKKKEITRSSRKKREADKLPLGGAPNTPAAAREGAVRQRPRLLGKFDAHSTGYCI